MALVKPQETKFGVNGEYIKIIEYRIQEDFVRNTKGVEIFYAVYIDAATRRQGKEPLSIQSMVFLQDYTFTLNAAVDTRAILYPLMKTKLLGAIDDV